MFTTRYVTIPCLKVYASFRDIITSCDNSPRPDSTSAKFSGINWDCRRCQLCYIFRNIFFDILSKIRGKGFSRTLRRYQRASDPFQISRSLLNIRAAARDNRTGFFFVANIYSSSSTLEYHRSVSLAVAPEKKYKIQWCVVEK